MASESRAPERNGLADSRGHQPHHFPEAGARSVRLRDRSRSDAARQGRCRRRASRTTRANPNTRKLLLSAALIMSVFLISSSVVVACLVPAEQLTRADGNGIDRPGIEDKELKAKDRALAYLAHGENPEGKLLPFFGEWFGTIYDLSTVVILWFAGASHGRASQPRSSVPSALRNGAGMGPAVRPLVLLFTVINLVVTLIFKANVDAQSAAYATGVLVLISSACVACLIDIWQRRAGRWFVRMSWPFLLITLVFFYTTVANVYEKPDGIKIAAFFIFTILMTSFWSRWARSRELRFAGFKVPDPETRLMWDTIRHLELTILVPHRPGRRSLANKEMQIRREHRIPRPDDCLHRGGTGRRQRFRQ